MKCEKCKIKKASKDLDGKIVCKTCFALYSERPISSGEKK